MIDGRRTCGALLGRCWVVAPCRAGNIVIRDNWWTHRLQCPVGGVSPEGVGGGRRPGGAWEVQGLVKGEKKTKQGAQLKNWGKDASLLVNIRRCGNGYRRSKGWSLKEASPI